MCIEVDLRIRDGEVLLDREQKKEEEMRKGGGRDNRRENHGRGVGVVRRERESTRALLISPGSVLEPRGGCSFIHARRCT
eukprot:scaffold239498_cov24-Tisochrysis_lutea.AAC.1